MLVVARAFNDIVFNLPFATAHETGAWQHLETKGNVAETVLNAATALNRAVYHQVFVASDFSTIPTKIGAVMLLQGATLAAASVIGSIMAAPGMIMTLSGAHLANTITVNGHVWTAGTNGEFHTAKLTAEWEANYQTMLAGYGASLTASGWKGMPRRCSKTPVCW